jgi:AraC-like DNA-binding protein
MAVRTRLPWAVAGSGRIADDDRGGHRRTLRPMRGSKQFRSAESGRFLALRHACTSVTTLHRRFQAELGVTPLAWLNGERVELARHLLEADAGGLDHVADRSGLGSAANLRRQFRRRTGLSPSRYRAAFAGSSAAEKLD